MDWLDSGIARVQAGSATGCGGTEHRLVKTSAGVRQPRTFRGLLLISVMMSASSSSGTVSSRVRLGMYLRMRPLKCSFLPRCHAGVRDREVSQHSGGICQLVVPGEF